MSLHKVLKEQNIYDMPLIIFRVNVEVFTNSNNLL